MPLLRVGAVATTTRSLIPSMPEAVGWMDRMPLLPVRPGSVVVAALLTPRVRPASEMVTVRPTWLDHGCSAEPPEAVSTPMDSITSAVAAPRTTKATPSRPRAREAPHRPVPAAGRSKAESKRTVAPVRNVVAMLAKVAEPPAMSVAFPRVWMPLVARSPRNSRVLPGLTRVRPV